LNIAPVITTLAEYQTRFWIPVAEQLRARNFAPLFVSFDDRSSEMIAAAGFPMVEANSIPDPTAEQLGQIFERFLVNDLAHWTSHERFAFGRSDDLSMQKKLARSILAAEKAIAMAQAGDIPVMVQEVGGFLSVIGSWFAAREAEIAHYFIEPSFFRGRLLFREGDFSAPVIHADIEGEGCLEFDAYLARTLETGQIVIPKKDAHHYSAAWKKVINLRNFARLAEKAYDKYVLRKEQEFGFIGQHVLTHVRALLNSQRLSRSYTDLYKLGRFIYFPLHVPGDIALTLRSTEYLDQLALVDFICRHLPDGVDVAIKEHPAMVGMMQPMRLREMLNRYPRLKLIDPATNNYAVMRQALGIVTINSKTGAEAGLLGLPVVVLGDAFYKQAPFAWMVDRLADLPQMMASLTSGVLTLPEPTKLSRWFAGAWDMSRPGELYATDAADIAIFVSSLSQVLDYAAVERGSALAQGGVS
jgi:hypothetical protein